MLENLIAEFIGLIGGILLVTIFGGRLAHWWAKVAFERKWKHYREFAADRIDSEVRELDEMLSSFGQELIETAEKSVDAISYFDYSQLSARHKDITESFERIENFFQANHFCLRERDIELATAYLAYTENQVRKTIFGDLNWANLDLMLDSHLRGLHPLEKKLGGPFGDGNRRDLLHACAFAIQAAISKLDRATWIAKTRALSGSLRSGQVGAVGS
jgi:hypothetical protein